MKHIWLIVQIKLLSDKKQMSVQHKKNFTKLDNHNHILVKKGLAAVARRFLETRKVWLRDGKVLFLLIRILFFSKNTAYFVIDPTVVWYNKKEKYQAHKRLYYVSATFDQTFKLITATDWYTSKTYFVFWVNHVAFKLQRLFTFFLQSIVFIRRHYLALDETNPLLVDDIRPAMLQSVQFNTYFYKQLQFSLQP